MHTIHRNWPAFVEQKAIYKEPSTAGGFLRAQIIRDALLLIRWRPASLTLFGFNLKLLALTAATGLAIPAVFSLLLCNAAFGMFPLTNYTAMLSEKITSAFSVFGGVTTYNGFSDKLKTVALRALQRID